MVRYARIRRFGPFQQQSFFDSVKTCLDIVSQLDRQSEIALCKLTIHLFMPFDKESNRPTQEAINHIHEAFAIYNKLGDQFYIARTLYWISTVTADPQARLRYLLQFREVATAAAIPSLSNQSLGSLGVSYYLVARYRDSANVYQEGIERGLEAGDKKWTLWNRPWQARSEFFSGNFKRVEALYHEDLQKEELASIHK